MSDQLILVLNCVSSSLKGAVIDRKSGSVVLSCLGERLTTPEAVITFNKDGNKRQVPLSGRNCHAGAVGMLLNELEKHGLHDRITPHRPRRRKISRVRPHRPRRP